jgi:GNAT superfamily N-acetyltransferase
MIAKLWRRCVFSRRRAYLFWDSIPIVAEPPPGDAAFICRLAALEDLASLVRAFGSYARPTRLRRWLERDDCWVLVAFDGIRPIGFHALSRTVPEDPVLPPLRLAPNQIWIDEMFVRPEYRRRGVTLDLQVRRAALLRSLGYDEVGSKIDEDNGPSLRYNRLTLSTGARVQLLTAVCVLGWRWRRVTEDARSRFEEHVRRLPEVAKTPRRLGG